MGELASSDFFDWAGTAFFLYYFFIRAFAPRAESGDGFRWAAVEHFPGECSYLPHSSHPGAGHPRSGGAI